MDILYDVVIILHFIGFILLSLPLFNIIIINVRTMLDKSFNNYADLYMENIIKNGSFRCCIFQSTVLISGVLVLIFGPLGIEGLWTDLIILITMILLFSLMGILSYLHFNLQPKILSFLADQNSDSEEQDILITQMKPYRILRKRISAISLFLVITAIILELQGFDMFNPLLAIILIVLGGLFSLKVNKTLIRFGLI